MKQPERGRRSGAARRGAVATAMCVVPGLVLVSTTVPRATADHESPQLLSVGPTGATTGESILGASSADGRWAVFASSAPEYGAGDGQWVPVLADVQQQTARAIPIGDAGSSNLYPAISPDGSTLAYIDSDVGPGLHVIDRETLDRQTVLNSDGEALEVGGYPMFFSHDGRYLLFSNADPLDIASPYQQAAIFDRDTSTYELVSRNNSHGLAARYSYPEMLSADGRYAYFVTDSPNMPDEESSGSGFRLFRRDTQTNETIKLQQPGPWWDTNLSANGRYTASASTNGISLIDHETGESEYIEDLPREMPWCQEFATETYVSNDAQRFVISTCQQDPYSTGVLWSFERATNTAHRIAGPLVGTTAPYGDLAGVVFDAQDGAVPGDSNGHSDVFLASLDDPVPPAQPHRYIALGDSFSSGEGVPPFFTNTDVEDGDLRNLCHRSPRAYPRLMADQEAGLTLKRFVACSGATSSHIRGTWQYENQAPQYVWLNKATDIVSITIGGNDVGFESFVASCVLASCQAGRIRKKIANVLPDELNQTFRLLRERVSSPGTVWALGYPYITPSRTAKPLGCGDFTPSELDTVRLVQRELNAVAESEARHHGFHYVDPTLKASPFRGHELCQRQPFFRDFQVRNSQYSFHPNVAGQRAYANYLLARLERAGVV